MQKLRSIALMAVAGLALALIPASAAPISFYTQLSGPNEEPPNPSLGTGTAFVTIDPVANTLQVYVDFKGLTGITTAAHIHVINGPGDANTADTVGPVATQTPSFIGFPLGVTQGTYQNTFDTTLASSFRAGFITAAGGTTALAEAALFQAIQDGRAYFNVHSSVYPGGEIRGFLQPTPEPATFALAAASLAGLVLLRRRQQQNNAN